MAGCHTGKYLMMMLLYVFREKQTFSSNVCLIFLSLSVSFERQSEEVSKYADIPQIVIAFMLNIVNL